MEVNAIIGFPDITHATFENINPLKICARREISPIDTAFERNIDDLGREEREGRRFSRSRTEHMPRCDLIVRVIDQI